jgi:hypothetical protein
VVFVRGFFQLAGDGSSATAALALTTT